MNRISLIIGAVALGCMASAAPAKKAKPDFSAALPLPAPLVQSTRTEGAIFSADGGYAPLHIGHRARAVGDPITILLLETTRTSKSASSQTDRAGGFSLTPPTSGPLSFFSPSDVAMSGGANFKGKGNAAQENSLTGTVSVTIAEVYTNGTALVRGQKLLELSQGEEWIQFSGIVRLVDLDTENRILSTRVADARIIYSGKGAVQRASREGWLSRFFNMISPF